MAKFSVQLLQKVICPTTYVLEDSVPKGNSYLDVFLFPIFPLFSPFFLSFYFFFQCLFLWEKETSLFHPLEAIELQAPSKPTRPTEGARGNYILETAFRSQACSQPHPHSPGDVLQMGLTPRPAKCLGCFTRCATPGRKALGAATVSPPTLLFLSFLLFFLFSFVFASPIKPVPLLEHCTT